MVDTVTIGARHINICEDITELANIASLEFCQLANDAIEKKGSFSVALSGGSTPVSLYKRLVSNEIKPLIDWNKIHFFVSDERCVPANSPDSNFYTAKTHLFDHIGIHESNLHPTKFQDTDPELSAQTYENKIKDFFESNSNSIPNFDLIFLGMGPDGHCASLFPGTKALDEKQLLVAANYVDRLKASRITFTFPLINNARNIIFLVSGNDKSKILADVLESKGEQFPAQKVMPVNGYLEWFIDEAAASKLFIIFNKK
jgi:6-phosphogluconolactonase